MAYDFNSITEVRLDSGAHESPEQGMCFMEMVAWFAGEKHSDKPDCASNVLGTYGIGLNDRMPDDVRDRLLKPVVPMIAGTFDPANEQPRAKFLAMWSVNKVLPIILRLRGYEELAVRCEAAKDLVEARSAAYAADAAADAANAADAAAYAANAAAYAAADAANAANAAYAANAAAYAAADAANAANAAYAANAAAYAAADAANAADAAAYAANAAAYAAADAEQIWRCAVDGLRGAIQIGRCDGFGTADLPARHTALRELVKA
jgi:hypothetical protein